MTTVNVLWIRNWRTLLQIRRVVAACALTRWQHFDVKFGAQSIVTDCLLAVQGHSRWLKLKPPICNILLPIIINRSRPSLYDPSFLLKIYFSPNFREI